MFSHIYQQETYTITQQLGVSPIAVPPELMENEDWIYNLAGANINCLNITTGNIDFGLNKSIVDLTNDENDELKKKIWNSIIVDLFLRTIIEARRQLSNNIAINISQIAKYTQDMGYFELCSKNIICNENQQFPISGYSSTYDKERSIKPYDVIKIPGEFKKNIELDDSSNNNNKNIRSRDSHFRINMKSICTNPENNSSCDTYINRVINWICQENNDLPIYNTDMIYTIITKFRKFDTSCKSFFRYMGTDMRTTKEERRLTKNLYKNFILLLQTAYNDIHSNDNTEQQLDKYMHNYEIERLFHFQLLPQIINIRRILHSHYPELGQELSRKTDMILINCAYLPNAFTRRFIILHIIEEYYGISFNVQTKDIMNANGIILEDTCRFTIKELSSTSLDYALKYIKFISRIYIPALHRTFFYSMFNTFCNTVSNSNNTLFLENTIFDNIMKTCRNQFIEKHLNPNLSNNDIDEQKNNYLVNPVNGYISNGNANHIISFDYYTVSADNTETTLSGEELDFVRDFFINAYNINTYEKNNTQPMNINYFGFDNMDTEAVKKKVALNCDFALSNSNYI